MNVFLVTSPFQYICANEARETYKTKNNLLVLIEQNNPIGQKQMSALFNEQDWDTVISFPRNRRTSITPKIIKAINQLCSSNLETLFYSEYFAWRSKLIIRNLPFRKHIFFDDGTMTFFDYYDHIEPKNTFYRPRWLQDFQLRLQGIKPIGKLIFFENTEIFSIFKFPNCVIKYRENTLETLKSNVEHQTTQFTPYDIFIGQGSVDEKGRINIDEYIEMIKSSQKGSDYPVLYIPHRTESTHVSEQVKKLKNITYHQPSYPIEIELSKSRIMPKNIIGLSSTALYTLSKIYPSSSIQLVDQKSAAQGERDKRIQNYLNNYFLSTDN
ncbi:polysialyltransferase family glycosyltransferase [Psychromonas sp. Urea-02u-13]|uniref:polysialyltransferase family glycosyltransferase n=1 Tax=Psychromonas sp. Urea-02u-13 TaxID=2058326 RepID=UPI000C33DA81|nr:polysialyltransferase family glycosyltransferase [Psychromonas sp. Urea-02u-13]PKG37743.1 hypothetical protein CXF74_17280 [Psychromonas sp. Urea-02u-13]